MSENCFITLGASHYLVLDGVTRRLTYSEYLAANELLNGSIEPEQLLERVAHHDRRQEEILCPICENGLLPRGVIEDGMTASLHEAMLHAPLEDTR